MCLYTKYIENPTDKTITDLWIKEAKERKNQIELNQTELINGDEVFRKIAKKFDK